MDEKINSKRWLLNWLKALKPKSIQPVFPDTDDAECVRGRVCDDKYPQISKKQACATGKTRTHFSWPAGYPPAIYTTNAIESPNSVIRRDNKCKVFPVRPSVWKAIYLAIKDAPKAQGADPALAAGNESFYY